MSENRASSADVVTQVTEFVEECMAGFDDSKRSQLLMYLDGSVDDISTLDPDVIGVIHDLHEWLT